jgi:hypothetical protein
MEKIRIGSLIKKAKPGKTTRPWGIPAPLLYQEEGN